MDRQKLLIVFALAVAVVLALTGILTGQPEFLIPTGLVGLVVALIVVAEKALSTAVMRRHDQDPRKAVSDEDEPLPSAHVITDDDSALGDTEEAHNEISPRDLPPDHPGRKQAEAQAGDERGTTRGDDDLLDVGVSRGAGRTADQPGKSEEMEGGSPELERPSRPVPDGEDR
ncbi:MAG TPA: hypothetical protein VGW11_03315 [Solirubrobacteraceae bacterium]|nr:hypothetical protein [Solirubrobacteraceae bacterium]